jgi:hypothetical protein
MSTRKPSPATIAAEIRQFLKDSGSAEHASGVQWFFKDEIQSHGWYTAKLRRAAVQFRRRIRKEFGFDFLVKVKTSAMRSSGCLNPGCLGYRLGLITTGWCII